MDASSVSGSLLLMKSEQTQQSLSTSMMKQAADQQNKMANLLEQNARQPRNSGGSNSSGFLFSTYA